jgi:hypothetical protein
MAKTKVTPQIEEVPTQPEQPAAPQSLTLQDLILLAQIIQLGSQRGTFRAEELASVGTVYNKVVAFLQESGAIAPAEESTTPEQTAPVTEE